MMLDASNSWNVDAYIEEVENTKLPEFLEYQKKEVEFLTNLPDSDKKTFIDIGAGYGRLLPHIAPKVRNIIAVELDKEMLNTLNLNAQKQGNVVVIEGDANHLGELLKGQDLSPTPVFIVTQNSLGTWVGGWEKLIEEIKKTAEPIGGEVVISIYRREALKSFGLQMYATLQKLAGEYDPEKSDLQNGDFQSNTGYKSHWFSDTEREEIMKRLKGRLVAELKTDKFHIFHISYNS